MRGAATWFACLAIFLNAFVVQTHVHPQARSGYSASRAETAGVAQATADRHSKATCTLCQALATASSATLGASASLDTPSASNIARASARIQRVVGRPSFSWQSRAPPILV